MSSDRYPTIQQVLPFFTLLLGQLDEFLECETVDDIPDYEELAGNGKPMEITAAVNAARLKINEYYDKTPSIPIYAITTGKLTLSYYFTHTLNENEFKL